MSYPVFYVPAGDVLPIFFDSFAGSTGASITMSGLAVTDIEIYKDGSVTQRASDAGYTLLDTDGIDFDALTGIHGFSIDTGDNTDAGFYTVGAWFTVVVSAITVDTQTVSFVAAQFRLMPAESVAGKPKVDTDTFGGTAGTFAGGRPEVNTTHAAGTAWNSGAIGANTLAADTITAAKIAADAIGASELAADAVAEIADGVWDEALSGHQTVGTAGRNLTLAGTILAETTAAGTPTTTTVELTAGSAVNDYYNDLEIIPVSGAVAGQARIILDYVGATKVITIDEAWTSAPSAGDAILIRTIHKDTKTQISDAVWDEATAGHTTAGTFGEQCKTDIDAILVDTAEIGVAGAGLTAIDLPDQTMNITGSITGNLSGSVGSVTSTVAITSNIKQNQALNGFTFLMTDSTNHNPSTGLTVTVTRSIDGGAFAAGTLSAVSEVGSGIYSVNFGAGDVNGKVIILKATATASDTTFERIVTQV